MLLVEQQIDKILARVYCQSELAKINKQSFEYAQRFSLETVSEIIGKSKLYEHDYENQINLEAMDCEEPQRPTLDV